MKDFLIVLPLSEIFENLGSNKLNGIISRITIIYYQDITYEPDDLLAIFLTCSSVNKFQVILCLYHHSHWSCTFFHSWVNNRTDELDHCRYIFSRSTQPNVSKHSTQPNVSKHSTQPNVSKHRNIQPTNGSS